MAKRKPLSKTELVARLHRGLRPKLDALQQRDLSLAHLANLDAMVRGEANESTLWDWAGGVLTWSKAAELLEIGEHEMEPQLQLVSSVVERYGRTGRIGLSGPEYQLAKFGVEVMDQLARTVDRPTAIAAADWSENKIQVWSEACAARKEDKVPA